MVHIYNLLPQATVDAPSVQEFQTKLTVMCRMKLEKGDRKWATWLSARTYDYRTLVHNRRFVLQ